MFFVLIEIDGIDVDDIMFYVKGKILKIQFIEGLFKDFDWVEIILIYNYLWVICFSVGVFVCILGFIIGDEFNLWVLSGGQLFVEVDVNVIEVFVFEGGVFMVLG